jgi:hypothetical protein
MVTIYNQHETQLNFVEVPENCFKVISYRLWNALRPDLCLNESVSEFKSIIKKELFALYQ